MGREFVGPERTHVVAADGFYLDYATMLHDYEWVVSICIQVWAVQVSRGVSPTTSAAASSPGSLPNCAMQWGLPDLAAKPMSDEETEMMWSLHGSIFIGIRQSVYHVQPPRNVPATVKQIVESFFSKTRAPSWRAARWRACSRKKKDTLRGVSAQGLSDSVTCTEPFHRGCAGQAPCSHQRYVKACGCCWFGPKGCVCRNARLRSFRERIPNRAAPSINN